jgi:hypothetical protein
MPRGLGAAFALALCAAAPRASQGPEPKPEAPPPVEGEPEPGPLTLRPQTSGVCETIERLMRAVEGDLDAIDELLSEARAADPSSAELAGALSGYLRGARERGGHALEAIDEALRHAHDGGGT